MIKIRGANNDGFHSGGHIILYTLLIKILVFSYHSTACVVFTLFLSDDETATVQVCEDWSGDHQLAIL